MMERKYGREVTYEGGMRMSINTIHPRRRNGTDAVDAPAYLVSEWRMTDPTKKPNQKRYPRITQKLFRILTFFPMGGRSL